MFEACFSGTIDDCFGGFKMPRKFCVGAVLSGIALLLPALAPAQVTNGTKPQLPPPFQTKSANNGPEEAKPPAGFLPEVVNGFRVNIFANGFKQPRWLAVAPDGDIFVADSAAGTIAVLRDAQNTGGAQQREEFAKGLDQPYGIAFRGDYVYVGDTDELLRFRYDPKTSKRLGEKEKLLELPHGGGHWTRTLAFSPDAQHLFIAVGSASNIDVGEDPRRAAITVCDPDGKNARLYATGLRNPSGIAIEPETGQLWAGVNERDGLGDDLPPDYVTSVQDGGFYGWPYSYIGNNVDPRVKPQKPELVARAIVPDVLLGAHRAPLGFAFYNGTQFPENYRGGMFLAEHGSWNRSTRAGYQVVFVAMRDGKALAEPQPFLTGFVPDPTKEQVYGRPVGVAIAPDGSLLVSDDASGLIYRVSVAK
jgi:glucose/arabinose dehydrogenase